MVDLSEGLHSPRIHRTEFGENMPATLRDDLYEMKMGHPSSITVQAIEIQEDGVELILYRTYPGITGTRILLPLSEVAGIEPGDSLWLAPEGAPDR